MEYPFFQPDYKLADPICTFVFSILVLITTITVIRDIIRVLMEGENFNMLYQASGDLKTFDQGIKVLFV